MKYATNKYFVALAIIAFIVFFACNTLRGVASTPEEEDTYFHFAIAGGVAFFVMAALAFFDFARDCFNDEK